MRVWLNIAERFYQLPLSLVGVAIGVALLPRLSTALQTNDHDDAPAPWTRRWCSAWRSRLPAAAALMAMPGYLVEGLFARGDFTISDAHASAALLFHYGWGLPAFVLIKILQPAFFARGDTRRPMDYSLISVAVNIGARRRPVLHHRLPGHRVATAAASWITVLQMVVRLWRDRHLAAVAARRRQDDPRRDRQRWHWAWSWRSLAFPAALEAPLPAFLGPLPKEVTVLLVCLAGAALYPALLFAFGGVTPAEARAALKRRKGDVNRADPALP